jgi:hypothetical protein
MMRNFRLDIIKRLNQIMTEIIKANDKELDKIGIELLEIEKKLMNYTEKKVSKGGHYDI